MRTCPARRVLLLQKLDAPAIRMSTKQLVAKPRFRVARPAPFNTELQILAIQPFAASLQEWRASENAFSIEILVTFLIVTFINCQLRSLLYCESSEAVVY